MALDLMAIEKARMDHRNLGEILRVSVPKNGQFHPEVLAIKERRRAIERTIDLYAFNQNMVDDGHECCQGLAESYRQKIFANDYQ